MADIRKNIELDLSGLKQQLTDITGSIEELCSAFTSIDVAVESADKLSSAYDGIQDAMSDMAKGSATASESMLSQFNKLFDIYDRKIAELKKEGGFAKAIGELAPSQLVGLEEGLNKVKSSMLAELPFGGLIGLMMLGSMREEEVRAMGAEVGRIFQQTGQVGTKEMARVGGAVRELGVYLGKGPTGMAGEVASSAAAFAQAGVDIEAVLNQKFSTPIKHSTGTILETSTALDSLFKQAAGTAARQMSTMIKDFNANAAESADIVASIGLAARDSGSSVEAFSTSVIRSAQALRTQRVDISEVAEAQLKFQKILAETPGITKQFAAGYAETGVGQITQGIAGMSVGLSAVLGERMTARGVGGEGTKTGLGAYYAMKEGFGGAGQTTEEKGVFTETVKELLSLAKENGRTVEEQRFFLEKMGMGFEGSKVLMTIGQEAEKSGSLQEAINKNQGDLNNAFVDRAKETSDFQRALLRIQDGIAKIGIGILGTIIAGFQGTTAAIKALMHAQLFGGNEVERKVAQAMMDRAGETGTQSIGLLLEGFKEVFQGFEIGMNAITGGRQIFVDQDEIRKKILSREADVASGRVSQIGTSYGGTQEMTATELQDVAKEAQKEALRVKQMGLMTVIKNETDALQLGDLTGKKLYTELENIYRREEAKPGGKGEEAVYRRMQEMGIRGSGVNLERLKGAEDQAMKNAYIDLGSGRGRAKLEVIIKAVGYESPTGAAEAR
jgi:hypothetical protein